MMTNRSSKLGLIVRADQSGLGYQTKALYDMLQPYKVLLIDSTPFNGRQQYYEWYENPIVSMGFPDDLILREFLQGLDVAISCEIFYHDNFVDMAKEYGVKTILQPNPELNPYVYAPETTKPDAFFLPSTWYKEQFEKMCRTYVCPPPITVEPVQRDVVKEKYKLKVLHVAGRRAFMDRNGTDIVHQLRNGYPIEGVEITIHDHIANPVDHPADIYKGDYHLVLIPRKYGGLCMPMYEALAHGLPVLMPGMSPNADVLPLEWMLPVSKHFEFHTKSRVRGGIVNAQDIASVLTKFRDMDNNEYQKHVDMARSVFQRYQDNLVNWSKYIKEVIGE